MTQGPVIPPASCAKCGKPIIRDEVGGFSHVDDTTVQGHLADPDDDYRRQFRARWAALLNARKGDTR